MGTHNVLLAHLATSLIVVLENALLALQVPMLVKGNRLAHNAQLLHALKMIGTVILVRSGFRHSHSIRHRTGAPEKKPWAPVLFVGDWKRNG